MSFVKVYIWNVIHFIGVWGEMQDADKVIEVPKVIPVV